MILYIMLIFHLIHLYCHPKVFIVSIMIVIFEVISVSGTVPGTEAAVPLILSNLRRWVLKFPLNR